MSEPTPPYNVETKPEPYPEYVSHKRVRALKLSHVAPDDVAEDYFTFTPADESRAPIKYHRSSEVVKRCKAIQMGDPGYLVVYPDDGFESWSPTAAFEKGYRLVEE